MASMKLSPRHLTEANGAYLLEVIQQQLGVTVWFVCTAIQEMVVLRSLEKYRRGTCRVCSCSDIPVRTARKLIHPSSLFLRRIFLVGSIGMLFLGK